jgi:hypothetical protein
MAARHQAFGATENAREQDADACKARFGIRQRQGAQGHDAG